MAMATPSCQTIVSVSLTWEGGREACVVHNTAILEELSTGSVTSLPALTLLNTTVGYFYQFC